MSRGSVGLGLATRQMSISSIQDKGHRKNALFFLCLSLCLLLLNVLSPSASNTLKHRVIDRTVTVAESLFAPAQYLSTEISRVHFMWNAQKYNEQLMAENERLLNWFQTANRLESENKALRDLLNMKDDRALEFQSGKVLSDAATNYSHTILVELGKNQGLSKGQGVLSHEGLIGRVVETGAQTSRVLLMNDVNSRIPVVVEGSQERAILAGTNNGDPILDHLPDTHNIVEGVKIVTSGHGGVFPYGVPVGETYINKEGQIAVRPFASPARANHVQVVNYGIPAGSVTRAVASNSGILR